MLFYLYIIEYFALHVCNISANCEMYGFSFLGRSFSRLLAAHMSWYEPYDTLYGTWEFGLLIFFDSVASCRRITLQRYQARFGKDRAWHWRHLPEPLVLPRLFARDPQLDCTHSTHAIVYIEVELVASQLVIVVIIVLVVESLHTAKLVSIVRDPTIHVHCPKAATNPPAKLVARCSQLQHLKISLIGVVPRILQG